MAEGFKDFAALEVMTAANTDDYLMRQTVMRFADASARNTALSGVLTEGLYAYLKDVNELTVYNGSAWEVAGHYGAWTSWTPTISQSAMSPDISKTVVATYTRVGRHIEGMFHCTMSAAGTGGSAIFVTLPVPCAVVSTGIVIGHGMVVDASTSVKYRALLVNSGSAGTLLFLTLHSTADGYLGATDFTAALATGDIVSGSFSYEAAS